MPRPLVLALFLIAALALAPSAGWLGGGPLLAQFVGDAPSLAPFVPTPQKVVDEMLTLAGVRNDDVVYDLGSGDGRIVITAAKRYGARGVGFELEDRLIRASEEGARREGVAELVAFRQQDVLTVDLSPATVVTIYLSQSANLQLRPKILSELRTGARIVSHNYHMGDWRPAEILQVKSEGGRTRMLYLWRIDGTQPKASAPVRLGESAS